MNYITDSIAGEIIGTERVAFEYFNIYDVEHANPRILRRDVETRDEAEAIAAEYVSSGYTVSIVVYRQKARVVERLAP